MTGGRHSAAPAHQRLRRAAWCGVLACGALLAAGWAGRPVWLATIGWALAGTAGTALLEDALRWRARRRRAGNGPAR